MGARSANFLEKYALACFALFEKAAYLKYLADSAGQTSTMSHFICKYIGHGIAMLACDILTDPKHHSLFKKVGFRIVFTKLIASIFLLLAVASTAMAGSGDSVGRRCESLLGAPPILAADNSYYCMAWNDGLVMQGAFAAGNNTFGAHGQTHAQVLIVDPSQFPGNTSWSWKWPKPALCCSVDSFYALYWGTGGYAVSAPSPPAPGPIRLNKIAELTQTVDLSYTDNGGVICIPPGYGTWTSNIDIIDDIFLFGRPDPPIHNDPRFEVEIALHGGPPQGRADARYTLVENGRSWVGYEMPASGSQTWDRWWFTPGRDILRGPIDLRAILRSMMTHRYATGDEWFLGVPLGSEVWCGTGSLAIRAISYHFQP